MIETINPATGEIIERIAPMDDAQVDAKLAAAARAAAQWAAESFAARGALLRDVAAAFRAERGALAATAVREMGKPLAQARAEVEKCAWALEYFAEHGEAMLAPQETPTTGRRSYVAFRPLGVLFAIMPWNFPFWQVIRAAAPALMAGNVVLLKHASNTTRCALEIERLFAVAGAPEGCFGALLVPGSEASRVIEDPRIAAVTLTGSEGAGIAVARTAGEQLKKCVLELGGSDPFIVAASADLERAIPMAVNARIQNNGQACIASKRFIVVRERADEFLDGFVEAMGAVRMGDPMDPATALGPLVSRSQRDLIASQVAGSLGAGAKAWVGGVVPDRRGFFYPATVLTDVPASSAAAREELFGPVAVVYVAEDLTDAIRIGNDTPWGLGGSIWAQDEAEIDEALAGMEVGLAFANAIVASMPELPFGGTKASGFGRELSTLGAREFTNAKSIFVQ